MSTVPLVRISFGELLFDMEGKALAEKFGHKIESKRFYFDRTYEYWQEWQKYEEKILTGLQEVLNVKFFLPVIDVTCVPFFVPKSGPVIMNFRQKPDQFVDILTHELIHLLLIDNDKYQEYEAAPKHFMASDWRKLFGDKHDITTLVHIPVHALLKYVYLDVLDEPSRLARDISFVKDFVGAESYVKAWEYVESHDYKTMIQDLKQLYVGAK